LLLDDPVEKLKGVGSKRKAALASLGMSTLLDLLLHMPIRYEDRRNATPIAKLLPDKPAVVRGTLECVERRKSLKRQNLWITTASVTDATGSVGVVWFSGWANDIADGEGREILLCGTPVLNGRAAEFASPEYKLLPAESGAALPQDAEWNRIIPIYPATEDMPRRLLSRIIYDCVTSPDLIVGETLPSDILKKRNLLPLKDALRAIHNPSSRQDIINGRRSLVYREFYELQKRLRETRTRRMASIAPSLAAGTEALSRFVAGLPFTLTTSQTEALEEITADLNRETPMTRLLQGDVGSGKTVVALAAAAKTLGAGYQVALLAPTTILSGQLYAECEKNLAPPGFPCFELTSATGAADKKRIRAVAREDKPLVLVGTHALLEEGVKFGNLGLAIIDEQHRFGVTQRSSMREKNDSAHLLMMSATPIPRTLCLTFYGDIDCSFVKGKPHGRQPIITRIVDARRMNEVYRFIEKMLANGGRCYWICPLIGGDGEGVLFRAEELKRGLRGIKVEALYGSMPPDAKRGAIERFASGDVPLLVSTTVVEVGVDVAEANVIVIEDAPGFGLSQLHQLRGRVGRGTKRGVCLLLEDSQKNGQSARLRVLENTEDGFAIAEADLKLRGEGELAGLRQHGDTGLRVADIAKDARILEWTREDVERRGTTGV